MAQSILYFYILLLYTCTVASIERQPQIDKNKENTGLNSKEESKNDKTQKLEAPVVKIDTDKIKNGNMDPGNVDNKKNKTTLLTNDNIAKISTNTSTIKNTANSEIESGAVMRGIYVFVGITLIFIMYIAFKTYRKGKGNRNNVIIKKYGVRTRRSDIEMEPLPLDEDEDDETVFDLGNVNNR